MRGPSSRSSVLPSTLHLGGRVGAEDIAQLCGALDHPEAVVWSRSRGVLYAGGERGQIYEISLEGTSRQIATTPEGGGVLGLAIDAEGFIVACDEGSASVLRIDPDGGSATTLSSGTPGRPMRLPNYPVFDRDGNLYISDSGDWGAEDGVIFVIDASNATRVWCSSASGFTNGLALAPDGRGLVVVESSRSRVVHIAIDEHGDAGELSAVFILPGSVPDGVAFDVEGNLYVSCYQPDAIFRVLTEGNVEVLTHDWTGQTLARPTNVAFAGPDLRDLVIANFGGSHLSVIRGVASGLPLQPALSSEL
ncbi:SMP-30/gluconolactonase/LRE family protein [Microbacterium sp.]|uniref:SMP-30/gluconolactonase/LRE family protein n=1 Tax=Microbacterium sp. TaxID=51671 RepID=UPI003F975B13